MSAPSTEPSAPPDQVAPRGAPLWMRVLLVASLAANLLIVGLAVGAVMGARGARVDGLPRDPASAVYLRALPAAERSRIGEALRRAGPDGHARREAFRAEVAATLALLRADPFDADAFARRLEGQRAAMADRANKGDALFVERLAAASPEERRAYADRLEEIIRRWSRRSRH